MGAYLDEMRRLGRRDPRATDLTDPDLAAFRDKIQSVFIQGPSEEVASAHIAKMLAEVANPSTRPFKVPLGRRLRSSLSFRVAAATAIFIGATGGLAYAGAFPDAMQDALSSAASKAGFELPVGDPGQSAPARDGAGDSSEDSGKSVKNDVLDAVRSQYNSGREKGDAVSDAATQNRNNKDHPNGDGVERTATDDPPASGRPNDPQDQGPKKP